MRRPLLSAVGQQRGSRTAASMFIQAPLRGLTSMQPRYSGDPRYASTLTNAWVDQDAIFVRPGSATFANRSGAGNIQTLGSYNAPSSASNKLYAFSSAGVFDITAGGAYGAAVLATTHGVCSLVNLTNSVGGAFLAGCNGVDSPFNYNGAAWAFSTITGVTGGATTLNSVWLFKRRQFFTQTGTSVAWYLPVDSVQGAAKKFPVGPLFTRGGYLLAGFSWSLDSGVGPDDYCGFVSSEGEVAIYAGTDPASAASFGLVGVFFLGKPANMRCYARVGGDVFVATATGLFSMNSIVKGRGMSGQEGISAPIASLWQSTWRNALATAPAWDVTFYSERNLVFVTIPSGLGTGVNFLIYNVQNNTWSYANTWLSNHLHVYNRELYMAHNAGGFVSKVWTGTTDWDETLGNGQAIASSITQVGTQIGEDSQILLVRPRFRNLASGTTFGGIAVPTTTLYPWMIPSIVNTLNQRHTMYEVIWGGSTTSTVSYEGVEVRLGRMTSP